MKKIFLIILIIILLPLIFFIDMHWLEPNALIVKKEKLYLPNWNKNLNGYKIAIITDLHIGTYQVNLNRVQKIVQKVNSNQPDLIVLLGDIDAKTIKDKNYSQDEIAQIFMNLKAKDDVLTILGNHDFKPQFIVENIFKKANIQILENTEKTIKHNEQEIRIVGLKDFWHYRVKPQKIIKKSDKPTIVLSHNPDVFPNMPDYVSLTLSGHTHGGEIYLPILGSPFVPSDFGQRYRKGLIIENGKVLYVCGGIACLSKLRFLNPPEISILTLYSQENKKINDTKVKKGFNKNYAGVVVKFLNTVFNTAV